MPRPRWALLNSCATQDYPTGHCAKCPAGFFLPSVAPGCRPFRGSRSVWCQERRILPTLQFCLSGGVNDESPPAEAAAILRRHCGRCSFVQTELSARAIHQAARNLGQIKVCPFQLRATLLASRQFIAQQQLNSLNLTGRRSVRMLAFRAWKRNRFNCNKLGHGFFCVWTAPLGNSHLGTKRQSKSAKPLGQRRSEP